MTVYFPDTSQFVAGVSLAQALACIARATEGDWLTDPTYHGFRLQAGRKPFAGYHFLESRSSAAAQAAHCYAVVGKTPLMIDAEPIGSGSTKAGKAAADGHEDGGHVMGCAVQHGLDKVKPEAYISAPAIQAVADFTDAYRKLGGVVRLVYLPKWYWQALGSPSLQPLLDRGLKLVSSQYTAYSDSGAGWAAYGGMQPSIWQYSSTISFGGVGAVDFNAYRGSVPELAALLSGPPPAPSPKPAPPVTEDDMPSGLLTAPAGVEQPVSFLNNTVGQVVIFSHWKDIQPAAPQFELTIFHASSDPFKDEITLPDSGNFVYQIGTKADVSAVTIKRIDKGAALAAYHTNG